MIRILKIRIIFLIDLIYEICILMIFMHLVFSEILYNLNI